MPGAFTCIYGTSVRMKQDHRPSSAWNRVSCLTGVATVPEAWQRARSSRDTGQTLPQSGWGGQVLQALEVLLLEAPGEAGWPRQLETPQVKLPPLPFTPGAKPGKAALPVCAMIWHGCRPWASRTACSTCHVKILTPKTRQSGSKTCGR